MNEQEWFDVTANGEIQRTLYNLRTGQVNKIDFTKEEIEREINRLTREKKGE